MRRREFIIGVGAATVASPFVARAQQPAMPVIGFLHAASPDDLYAGPVRAFHQGLNDTGFVEGRNVAIEYRWAYDEYNRLPEMAADLVRKQVSAIVAAGAPSSPLAAKAATTTIPIIFNLAVDPVQAGFVASLSRPGGNLTGVSNLNVELIPKRLELLHEILPKATVMPTR
jgi:putative ABC transport system substrate-binding protein